MNKLKIRLSKLLKEFGEETKVKEFIDFEARLFVLEKLDNKINIKNGWTVFTKYFDIFKDIDESSENNKIIFNLIKENHSYSTANKWVNSIKKYVTVSQMFRMYDVDDEGKLIRIVPKFESNRDNIYEQYFNNLNTVKSNNMWFAENTIEYKSRFKKEGSENKKIYRSEVIEIDNNEIKSISLYKNKKYIKLNKNKDWQTILNNMGEDFQERPNITMKILNNKDELELRELVHIVGTLGAGKSTYKYAQVYEGVNNHNLKIGIIEDNVANVINTVKTLRSLNINAIPVIGLTNEKNHLVNYLSNINDFDKVENDEIVQLLSGSCILKIISKDEEEDFGYPCNRLYEENNKVYCPYCSKCGHMERLRRICEADVLVTTPHNLVKGSIPGFIDIYNRSVYEIFYDLLDMIIVDEADGIQSILDEQLIPTVRLNYGEENIKKDFIKIKDHLAKDNRSRENLTKYKFMKNVSKLERTLYSIERILPKLENVKSYIMNKMWTPKEVFKDIESVLNKEDTSGNKKFISTLKGYVYVTDTFYISEANLTHQLNELYNKISDIHITDQYPEQKLVQEIEIILEKFKVKIPKKINRNLFIEKIGFLLMIVQLDYMLKVISNEYPYMSLEVYGEIRNIDRFASVNRKLEHLIKEACIDTIYGYKFGFRNGLNIDTIRYDGVGRSMLELWPTLKSDIGLEGPCVICLSGTSFSPGSAHYNLKKEPDVLLEGKAEGKINMEFLPKVYNENYIRISGISNREIRSDNLKNLAKELIGDIKIELENLKGKKVLLVVNSYDDCKVVGEILRFNNINYTLVQSDKEEDSITKDYIESLPNIDIDVCVVPLSIIARGYNILDEDNNSYFGSMFFLVRPYMVPGDFSSYIQILHHYLYGISEEIKSKDWSYEAKVEGFRKRCYMKFSDILEMSYWKALDSEEKEIMSWFMIVPIKQAIGRMQRNGNECNVFFCDAAFSSSVIENQKVDIKNSIVYAWYDTLSQCIENDVIRNLYGEFYNGLEKMINKINQDVDEYVEEEWD